MDEIQKPNNSIQLPKAMQVMQLFAVQGFLGALVACSLLYWPPGEKIITNAFGSKWYAIFFGTFFMIGVVAGFAGGSKAFQWLIQIIRLTKGKDE